MKDLSFTAFAREVLDDELYSVFINKWEAARDLDITADWSMCFGPDESIEKDRIETALMGYYEWTIEQEKFAKDVWSDSGDYVRWNGVEYGLSPHQAAIFNVLINDHDRGILSHHQESLLFEAGLESSRVTDVFPAKRKDGKPQLVVKHPELKGHFRLAPKKV